MALLCERRHPNLQSEKLNPSKAKSRTHSKKNTRTIPVPRSINVTDVSGLTLHQKCSSKKIPIKCFDSGWAYLISALNCLILHLHLLGYLNLVQCHAAWVLVYLHYTVRHVQQGCFGGWVAGGWHAPLEYYNHFCLDSGCQEGRVAGDVKNMGFALALCSLCSEILMETLLGNW